MKVKGTGKILRRFFSGAAVAVACLALATNAHAVTTTVDFDALDTSGGPVSGTALDAYLAGFGITLTIPAGGGTVHATGDVNSGATSFATNVVAPSAPNILEQINGPLTGGTVESYTLEFDIPLISLSFTRAGRCTPLAFPDWTAVAKDSSSATLATVGEPDGGTAAPCDSPTPSVMFTLSGPGIKSVIFTSGHDGFSGRTSPAFDDLVFEPIPESATLLLFGSGLVGLGFIRRRKRAA